MSAYAVHLTTLVGIYALMGVGYQLVFGHLGALNLAQGALFGVGAYATALLAPTLGVAALPAALDAWWEKSLRATVAAILADKVAPRTAGKPGEPAPVR